MYIVTHVHIHTCGIDMDTVSKNNKLFLGNRIEEDLE